MADCKKRTTDVLEAVGDGSRDDEKLVTEGKDG